MHLEPITLPSDRVPHATLSCVITLLARIDALELRVSELSQGKPEMSGKVSDDLVKKFFEEWKATVLARFGE